MKKISILSILFLTFGCSLGTISPEEKNKVVNKIANVKCGIEKSTNQIFLNQDNIQVEIEKVLKEYNFQTLQDFENFVNKYSNNQEIMLGVDQKMQKICQKKLEDTIN